MRIVNAEEGEIVMRHFAEVLKKMGAKDVSVSSYSVSFNFGEHEYSIEAGSFYGMPDLDISIDDHPSSFKEPPDWITKELGV
jgi:hypothetical protein